MNPKIKNDIGEINRFYYNRLDTAGRIIYKSPATSQIIDDYNGLSKEEYERQKEEMIKSSRLYEKKERW